MDSTRPITLAALVDDAGLRLLRGSADLTITGVTADSRTVQPGCLFVATGGLHHDGHDFIDRAIAAGAVAVLAKAGYSPTPAPALASPTTDPSPGPAAPASPEAGPNADAVAWLAVDDPNAALGLVAAAFYRHPSRQLELVGITGTNGKTTVATLCCDAFTALGYVCGLVGTVEVRIGGEARPATHTTPDAVAVQATLAEMAAAGCGYVFMEVSSHALVQHRTAGCRFAGGVFTNISHDHLDYHGDMLSYIAAKKLLFDGLAPGAFALVNADDKRGEVMLQNCRARQRRYALRQVADYKARILEDGLRGLHLDVDGHEVYTRIAGHFNAYNLLAAYGIGRELGQSAEELLGALSALPGAPGRLQLVVAPSTRLTGVVDYAHTPDALRNVLATLQTARQRGHRILTVFGCGGDRDRAKRPLMGAIAAQLSDIVVVTDDNPRGEDAAAIRAAVLAGTREHPGAQALEIADRSQAIQAAVVMARDEDVILVAGKGHETYQEVAGVRKDFDDRVALRGALESLPAGAGRPT